MIKIPSIHRLLWLPNRILFRKYTSEVTKMEHKLWSIQIANIEFNLIRKNVALSDRNGLRKFEVGARKHLQTDPIERNFPYKARIVSFKIDPNAFKADTDSSGSDSDLEIHKKEEKVESASQSKQLGKGVEQKADSSSSKYFTDSKLHKEKDHKGLTDSTRPLKRRKCTDNNVYIDWCGSGENLEVDKKIESKCASNENQPVDSAGKMSVKDVPAGEPSKGAVLSIKKEIHKTKSSDKLENLLDVEDIKPKKETGKSFGKQLVKVSKDICSDPEEKSVVKKVIIQDKLKTEPKGKHENLLHVKDSKTKNKTVQSFGKDLIRVSKNICSDHEVESGDEKLLIQHQKNKYSKSENEESAKPDCFDTEKIRTISVKEASTSYNVGASSQDTSNLTKIKSVCETKEKVSNDSCSESDDVKEQKPTLTQEVHCTTSKDDSKYDQTTKATFSNKEENLVSTNICNSRDSVEDGEANELTETCQNTNHKEFFTSNNNDFLSRDSCDPVNKTQFSSKKEYSVSSENCSSDFGKDSATRKVHENSRKDFTSRPFESESTTNKKSKIDLLRKNKSDLGVGLLSAKKRTKMNKKLPRESLSPREHISSTIYDRLNNEELSTDHLNCDSDDGNNSSSGYCSSSSNGNGSSSSDSDDNDDGNSSVNCENTQNSERKGESTSCDYAVSHNIYMSLYDYMKKKYTRTGQKIWNDLESTDNGYLSKSTSVYCNQLESELLTELKEKERLKEEKNTINRKPNQRRDSFKRISEWENVNKISK